MTNLELKKKGLKEIFEQNKIQFIKEFYQQNKLLLTLNTPFEKWNDDVILFSSNNTIKGNIYFKLNSIEFKLKHKLWMPYTMSATRTYNSEHWFKKTLEIVKNGEFIFPSDQNGKLIYEQIPSLCINIKEAKQKFLKNCEQIKIDEEQRKIDEARNDEQLRLDKLSKNKTQVLQDLDKNSDGVIDVIEGNDFNKILQKNQKLIIDIDRDYIQKFVKVSNYIKNKKENIQLIFESISQTKNNEELNEQIHLVKNQIHTYELLIYHSINMIGALVAEEMIVFYEIYESFDKLGIFNSNWESEVSGKLTNIGDKLDDLMQSIYNMEKNIVSELSNLSYVTQESFVDLNRSVTNQLREVESSINTNNLLTGIQAYQLYKINKNTKGLRQ